MLKIKELYAIAAPAINLADWNLNPHWFKEVDALENHMSTELLETLMSDGRLVVKQLLEKYYDHRRSASMHTVWFDGKPVMLVQDAGREGNDFKQRWITDRETYTSLCGYLQSRLADGVDEKDLVGDDEPIYEDEIFCFYGENFAEQFGYECEPVTDGYLVFSEPNKIFPSVDKELYFVEAKDGLDMPRYIRRRGFVLEKARPVSAEELASSPRVQEACLESGHTQLYFYRACERPDSEPILSV